ncbi:RNA-directed DNA polymerase, eukaryota, Reverse transcriptase zinc-binding domain protein [Artemisia annua]|uniref:RNA-directed DNA polymerase, eukaryota, Reverse transcriptase zinc-binding domain protein n=1 Tax=Artemisia annua TaxID=35608 RepID=A0A2U1NX09_ARTAN|nr:RNA-directed DNA polymerase, eukaryota, Reverse transcriptase zinc-binding domain protein [Artemisia annua]
MTDVWNWNWRRHPTGRALGDLSSLNFLINGLVLDSSNDDKWTWALEDSGQFSVKSLCKAIHNKLFVREAESPSFRWNSWVPRKVNICAWRVALNRLPTSDNLMQRGVQLSSSLCAFCGLVDENRDHCLLSCPRVKSLWVKIWSWWGSPALFNPSLPDILMGSFEFLKDKWVSRAFHGVCLTTLWHIWNWRNKISHATLVDERIAFCDEDIFPVVQRISLLWVSNRASKYRVTWNQWIHSPAEMRPP